MTTAAAATTSSSQFESALEVFNGCSKALAINPVSIKDFLFQLVSVALLLG